MVNIKKEKDALLKKADELEKKAESRLLTQREIDLKQTVKDRLAHLLREEEVKWFQRAKTTKLLMGDRNTEYFHAVANGKRRKTRIYGLEQNEGVIEGEDDHKRYITNYYKGLFGPSKKNIFSMDESRTGDIPQVTDQENERLTADFTEKEVRGAIFQMKHNKALELDGFLAEFNQVFWSLIKHDLMAMFKDFHKGNLPIFSLNFGIISLIPKMKEAKMIQ